MIPEPPQTLSPTTGRGNDFPQQVIHMTQEITQRFPAGRAVVTRGVYDKIESGELDVDQVCDIIIRHLSGDWGEVCDEDRQANEDALDEEDPGRLHSVYNIGRTTYWIITEWDRSATTVLLPEEY